jgi:hypothetical protein
VVVCRGGSRGGAGGQVDPRRPQSSERRHVQGTPETGPDVLVHRQTEVTPIGSSFPHGKR